MALLVALGAVFNSPAGPEAHTKVQLLLPVETARPGETVLAGMLLRMDAGWHTYWKNSGDSGTPTEIEWQLPAGVTAGEIQWPTPEKLSAEGMTTYILKDEAILFVPLKFSADLKPGPVELKAKVSWLECMESCIPGEDNVIAQLTIGSERKPSPSATVLEAAQKKLPLGDNLAVTGRWEKAKTSDTRPFVLEWAPSVHATEAEFYPDTGKDFEVQGATELLPAGNGLRKVVKKLSGNWPSQITGTLTLKAGGEFQAHTVVAAIGTATTASGAAGTATGATPKANSPTPGFPALGILLVQLLAALGGGVIMNLMPCVLPILSLKVLSLVYQHGKDPAVARRHSLIYLLGVLVSFWFVAALVMVGRLASWGEQFQDARFVVSITVLMTLIALNLFGVFEFVLPGRAVGSATELAAREGGGGAFFNGILAVVLGASCVAPLMATAVGWAITQPPVVIALIFSAIGLGLALPYVALTFFPALQKVLPRPGAWMEKFKIALGFPMLGMAAWGMSLVVVHHGRRGALWVGVFLVLMGLAAWVYGEFIQRGSHRKGLAWIVVLACLGTGYGYALEHKLDWRHPAESAPGDLADAPAKAGGIQWERWSPKAVAAGRAAGRPVFVDFTADWCLTCQANKASSIEIDPVRKKLKEINAVTLVGDYTRKNAAITEELKRFERAGVPLVLVYPRDGAQPPELLPTVLTPTIVLNALEKAAK
jgi:thiol:disulfide interchange protein DsbD